MPSARNVATADASALLLLLLLRLLVCSCPVQELWAKWVGLHGKAMKFTVRAPLRPAADSGALIAGLLDSLLSNLDSLRATSATLEQQCREWRGAAESSQALVENYVDRQEQHEREMSEKVGGLWPGTRWELDSALEGMEINAKKEAKKELGWLAYA